MESNIKLDGDVDVEWNDIPKKIETDSKNEIQVSWQSAVFNESMYLLFSVKDEQVSLRAVLRLPQQKGYLVPENEPENGF